MKQQPLGSFPGIPKQFFENIEPALGSDKSRILVSISAILHLTI
jgi:hypothetical protein